MDQKNIFEHISQWAKEWPKNQTQEMSDIARLAISEGWFLNEWLLIALCSSEIKDLTDFSAFIENEIISEWDSIWDDIARVEPSRTGIFHEAKMCFENGYYAAAIHLFFSQADGIFQDKFGIQLYTSEGIKARNKVNSYLVDFIAKDSLESLCDQLSDGSWLRRMFNEIYVAIFKTTASDAMRKSNPQESEHNFSIPNRHGVIHGSYRDYGNKTNALKCFSLFLSVIYAIHGDKISKPL